MMTSVYFESTWSRSSSIFGSIIVTETSSFRGSRAQYTVNLVYRLVELVVDHAVREVSRLGELAAGRLQPPAQRRGVLRSAPREPGFELLPARGLDKDRARGPEAPRHLVR